MNENINLCEILKDCPINTEFYSPLIGNCKLSSISDIISVTKSGDVMPGLKTQHLRGSSFETYFQI